MDAARAEHSRTKPLVSKRDALPSSRKRYAFWLGLFVVVTAVTEMSVRLCLASIHRLSILKPSTIMSGMYRQLDTCDFANAGSTDNVLHVLLLGGSALYRDYGNVEHLLSQDLATRGVTDHRICNLSAPSHTTRDSYLKYHAVGKPAFDVVVVYHGINEVRANNCPADMFDESYSHYAWYEQRNLVHRHLPYMNLTVIPYFCEYAFVSVRNALVPPLRAPEDRPHTRWLQYGGEIKTAGPFAQNIEKIVAVARRRGESVLLLTFAYYIPEGYTFRRFREGRLGYDRSSFERRGTKRSPIELWGTPRNVAKGLRSHNHAIEGIVKDNPDVYFLDMYRRIPAEGEYFRDICHFSRRGCALFSQELAEAIVRVFADRVRDR